MSTSKEIETIKKEMKLGLTAGSSDYFTLI
jgi:hypothetical protein